MADDTLRKALSGDIPALEALCARCHPMLCRFFLRLTGNRPDAEDLAQDTLVAMLRALPGYRALPGRAFDGWLLKIGYNRFIDLKRRKAPLPLPEGFDLPDLSPNALGGIVMDERAQAVRRAMEGLDEELRAMVAMRYDLAMDYLSIAGALGTHPARVKWRLNDALKKLKRQLEAGGFTYERI